MHLKKPRFARGRRTVALFFSFWTFLPHAEAGSFRPRRQQLICGAALLTAAASSVWWLPLEPARESSPGLSPQASLHPTPTICARPFVLQGESPIEVKLFHVNWTDKAVAERIKAKLVGEYPEAKQLPLWTDPGLRVPVTSVHLEHIAGTDTAHVWLECAFLKLRSAKTVSLSEIRDGKSATAHFVYSRKESFGQSAEMNVDLDFRYLRESAELEVKTLSGDFKVVGPGFEHTNTFRAGPWKGRAGVRVADADR